MKHPRPFSLRNKARITSGALALTLHASIKKRLFAILRFRDEVYDHQPDPSDQWTTSTSSLIEAAKEFCIINANEELMQVAIGPMALAINGIKEYFFAGEDYRMLDLTELYMQQHSKPFALAGEINPTMEEEGIHWELDNHVFYERLPTIPVEHRQIILDYLIAEKADWSGRLPESEFVARLLPSRTLLSHDRRYQNFHEEIVAHQDELGDWQNDWIFRDDRINLEGCTERRFIRFLELVLDPTTHADKYPTETMRHHIGPIIGKCGYQINKSDIGVATSRYTISQASNTNSLGQGGYGRVIRIGVGPSALAVKTLLPEHRGNTEAQERFKYEVSILKKLSSLDCVIRLKDEKYGDDPWSYSMEAADCSLADYLLRHQRLPRERRVDLIKTILMAFVQIHAKRVVHRDICPHNILIKGTLIKVCDFGAALDRDSASGITRTNDRIYKAGYAAPEIYDGLRNATEQSDVFAIGKIIQLVLLDKQAHEAPSGIYASLINTATHTSREHRYQSVDKLLSAFSVLSASDNAHHSISSLSDLSRSLTFGQPFDPGLFHRLVISCDPDSPFDDYWTPLLEIVTTDPFHAYSSWANIDGRIIDFVKKCQTMFDLLPTVGWPFGQTTAMTKAVMDAAFSSDSSQAKMAAVSFAWLIGMSRDQWGARDTLLDYLDNSRHPMDQEFIGHVLALIHDNEINTKIPLRSLHAMHPTIARAIRAKRE